MTAILCLLFQKLGTGFEQPMTVRSTVGSLSQDLSRIRCLHTLCRAVGIGMHHLRMWGMIWELGRRRCSAAVMKDSMAATWALMLFLLPTAPVSAARNASALTEPAQSKVPLRWAVTRHTL